MSLPEISRRCLSCGAAVRAQSRFCPQCGKNVEGGADGESGREADAPPGGEIRLDESRGRWEESVGVAKEAEGEAVAGPIDRVAPGGGAEPVALPPPSAPDSAPATPPAPDELPPPEGEDVRRTGGADAPLARPRAEVGGRRAALKEGTRARVERVREASRGVIEDAAEDSGLRFVLIAVFLFLLFLFFLYLNQVLK